MTSLSNSTTGVLSIEINGPQDVIRIALPVISQIKWLLEHILDNTLSWTSHANTCISQATNLFKALSETDEDYPVRALDETHLESNLDIAYLGYIRSLEAALADPETSEADRDELRKMIEKIRISAHPNRSN